MTNETKKLKDEINSFIDFLDSIIDREEEENGYLEDTVFQVKDQEGYHDRSI